MTIMSDNLKNTPVMTAPPVIWYVHHYAGGPDVGRFYRPFELAKSWQAKGAKVVIIAAAFHHILNVPGSRQGLHNIGGVPYEFLPAPAYKRSGMGRLLNMLVFSMRVLRHAKTLTQRYGVPDLIIGSSPHLFIFPVTHRLARRFKAVSVFEVRDLWPLSITELLGVSTRHPLVMLMDYLQRRAYKYADAVVSLLPGTLPYMLKHGLNDSRRWYYIPNGADMLQVASSEVPSDALNQAQQWRKEGKFILAYVGALGVPNNMTPLIEAMAMLRGRGEHPIAVVIAGQGEQEQQLKTLVKQKRLQDCIMFYPQISKEAVFSLLQSVDAGYLSVHRKLALYRFGVSLNKLYDYLRFKLPVIYAIEAGNDPVRECQCGYSVAPDKPGDIAGALTALAALPAQERLAMGERGYQFGLREHHYPRLAQRYLDILDHSKILSITETSNNKRG